MERIAFIAVERTEAGSWVVTWKLPGELLETSEFYTRDEWHKARQRLTAISDELVVYSYTRGAGLDKRRISPGCAGSDRSIGGQAEKKLS